MPPHDPPREGVRPRAVAIFRLACARGRFSRGDRRRRAKSSRRRPGTFAARSPRFAGFGSLRAPPMRRDAPGVGARRAAAESNGKGERNGEKLGSICRWVFQYPLN